MTFNLFKTGSDSFGLDISDGSLRIIKLKKRGNDFEVVFFGETFFDLKIVRDGEIKNIDSLAQIIKKFVISKEINSKKIKNVVVSLPEEKSFLQVIKMPLIPLDSLRDAVVYEAENYIPVPIEEVYLDFQIIESEKEEDHLKILIAALPKTIIDPYFSAIKKAGLFPIALEIESLAVSRALIKTRTYSPPVLIVDFGANNTSFIIYSGRTILFTSSFPISSREITEEISRVLDISIEEAEELKIKNGLLPANSKKDSKVFEIISERIEKLTDQIIRHIDYYKNHKFYEHLPGGMPKKISKIILSGGASKTVGLKSFIEEKIDVPVELGDPWINVCKNPKKEINPKLFKNSLSYPTVIGLALKEYLE